MEHLKGKSVVVTGGAGSLGSAVVTNLLEVGARCFVPLFESDVEPTVSWSGDARVTTALGVDLTNEAAVEAYMASVPALWGSVHIAGGFAMAPLLETSLEAFRGQLDLNLVTCFLSCREAARAMKSSGGRIVNVASQPAVSSSSGMSAYATAKAGVAALTRHLAEELKGDDILVNAIVPSIIDTPANRQAMPDADHDCWPKGDEIAAAIRFLVSPENRLTHGLLMPVYGRA